MKAERMMDDKKRAHSEDNYARIRYVGGMTKDQNAIHSKV